MASSLARRSYTGLVVPVLAVAAFSLVGCTNSQETSDSAGTTPPVWTGSSAPESAGAESGEHGGGTTAEESVVAQLKDAAGKDVGTATFAQDGKHLTLTVEAKGLTPGFHGLHVHQTGKCEGDFASAGGHYQAPGHTGEPASGDLTSLAVLADGTATLTTNTDQLTLDELRADGGRAIIVHAGADNFGNVPNRYTLPDGAPAPDEQTRTTGDAGGRVACGVFA